MTQCKQCHNKIEESIYFYYIPIAKSRKSLDYYMRQVCGACHDWYKERALPYLGLVERNPKYFNGENKK